MQDDMVQVGHSRGIFDLSNCFCLDLNLEYVLMDFISLLYGTGCLSY